MCMLFKDCNFIKAALLHKKNGLTYSLQMQTGKSVKEISLEN